MKNNICHLIGNFKTSFSSAEVFFRFCKKNRNRKYFGHMSRNKGVIGPCKNCAIGKALKEGEYVLPENVNFMSGER